MSHLFCLKFLIYNSLFFRLNSAETINANYEFKNKSIVCDPTEDCNIICGDTESCFNAIITCPPNATCSINCNGFQSCQQSTIDCPSNGNCIVGCNGNQGCTDANIIWKTDQPNHIVCANEYKSCKGITISPFDQNTDFTFICNASINSEVCSETIINCPSNASCNIYCTGVNACLLATINGPKNNNLLVTCDERFGVCNQLTIKAENTSSFTLNGCIQGFGPVCSGINIYFPPHNNGIKRGIIGRFDGTGLQSPTFYAINGWSDVDMIIDYIGISGYIINGQMFCSNNYSESCNLTISTTTREVTDASCVPNNICGDPMLRTQSPTKSPTKFPTMYPSVLPTFTRQTPDLIIIITFNFSVLESNVTNINIQSLLKNLTIIVINEGINNITDFDCKDTSTIINVIVNEVQNSTIQRAIINANSTFCGDNDIEVLYKLKADALQGYLEKDFITKLNSKQKIILIANGTVNIDVDIIHKINVTVPLDVLITTINISDIVDDDNIMIVLLVIGCCLVCCIVLICLYLFYKSRKEHWKHKDIDVAMTVQSNLNTSLKNIQDMNNELIMEEAPGENHMIEDDENNGDQQTEGDQSNVGHNVKNAENDVITQGNDENDILITGNDETDMIIIGDDMITPGINNNDNDMIIIGDDEVTGGTFFFSRRKS
eukprot:170458_1